MTLDSKTAHRLWQYLKPYWRLELITLLVMIFLSGLALVLPIAIQYMIDNLIPGLAASSDLSRNMTRVITFGSVLLSIYLANVFLSWLRDFLATTIGAGIIADIRSQLFYHLEQVSIRFYQKNQIGEIMSRLLSDVARLQDLMTSTLLSFLTNIFLLIAISCYLLTVNWILTLVALIPVPLTILFSNFFGRRMNTLTRRVQEAVAALTARLQEALLGTRIIRAFGQEEAEKKRVDLHLQHLKRNSIRLNVTNSLSSNFIHFVNMIGPIVVLAWGTYLVAGGSVKLGALVAFYILLSYLYSPIRDIASINIEIHSAMASVTRVFEYLDLPPAITEDPHPVQPQTVEGAISFRGVSFRYDENGFEIDGLSLDIKSREKIAIVGPSGSGKTTLINLIMRLYDPQAGSIMLDGIDIRKLPVKLLRDSIGLVDQDPLLFKTSIFGNIAYADPEASMEKVTAAARVANIHDFISSLPDKYQGEVGERGVTLSGGERQRLCLARAILRNPPILILDEATSSLDSNSEELIQEALKKMLADKTAIIIAHRLSTVQHVDRIIVMDGGRIVSQGNHAQLLERSPLYRDLAAKQLLI